ncbi:MAG: site-2 protease family protein [Candidatus Omnitrophota bacterium]
MIIPIIVFIIVIVVHEVAHGYTAYLLGDDTAKNAGRLSLNPIVHADIVGTIILPVFLIAVHSPVIFGWAKPVPINPRNFKNPRKGILLSSLAGPAANFCLAVLFALIFKTGIFAPHSIGWTFLATGIIISLVLGIFNLIPIPPLDGSNILMAVLPLKFLNVFARIEKYGFIILIVLLYLGLFDRFILPLVSFLTKVLIG